MEAQAENIIWQYWETRGTKPDFIEGCHEIAKRNSGVKVVLVTPETLDTYLPDLERDIHRIEDLAHKADMIRTRLVMRHGGMWLDSDAIVLGDLNWLFDCLRIHEFVGFNDERRLQPVRPFVRVNCFLSRPNGTIIREWVRRQHEKLPQTTFGWSEIGAEMLNPICLENRQLANILPFESICPIAAKDVERFLAKDDALAEQILEQCFLVMVSNRSMQLKNMLLRHLKIDQIAAGDSVISKILQRAMAPVVSTPPDPAFAAAGDR